MKKSFPTLYSRTNTGAVQVWTIYYEGNKYWSVEGLQGGKETENLPTVAEGKNIGKKNESSPDEQAKIEAKAKWDKKIKKGYFESLKDIDNTIHFEPMLAKSFEDYKDKINWAKGVIVQCKFNGLRCIGRKEGLFTRTGERYCSVPHIEEDLKSFFYTNPTAILDGELFNQELRQQLNKIVHLCRQTKNITPEELKQSEEIVRYYIYDGMEKCGDQEDYSVRKPWVDDELKTCKYYRKVEDYLVYSFEEMNKVYQTFLADGQEGAIIRIQGVPYENKRSKFLLKWKPIQDAEFVIMSVEEGQGNWAGMAKIIGLRMPDNKEFNATFKGTMEEAKDMLKNKQKYIGQIARIFFFGKTGLGCPNYAQFNYNNWKVGDK